LVVSVQFSRAQQFGEFTARAPRKLFAIQETCNDALEFILPPIDKAGVNTVRVETLSVRWIKLRNLYWKSKELE
jgi:hypothetical protein